MLNRRQTDDWSTPKLATTRSSPSRNDSLIMIKKGISKSGSRIGEAYKPDHSSKVTKEHAIDSTINMMNTTDDGISLKNRTTQLDAFPPKASVHMISRPSQDPGADGFWATMKPQCYGTPSKDDIDYEPRTNYGMSFDRSNRYANVGVDQNLYRNVDYCTVSQTVRRSGDQPVRHVENLGSLQAFTLTDNNPVTVRDRQVMHLNGEGFSGIKGETQVTSQLLQHQTEGPHYDIYQSVMQIKALPSAFSLVPVSSKDSINSDRSSRWDQVMAAKDDLIQQKDLIITRQKQTIEQLQFHIGDIEERINQNTYRLTAQRKDDERYKEKLKEAEGHAAQLKAQLLHLSTTKQEEVEKLQKKLGETEYELQKLEKGFKDVGRGQAKEIAELKQKIEDRNETDKKLKKSIELLQSDLKNERRKAHSLKQYLENLPTEDEHNKSQKEIKDMKTEKAKLEERIEDLEERLKELKGQLKQKKSQLEGETLSKSQLQEEINRLSDTVGRYKEREKNGPVTMEEFDEAKWDNERLKADCERLKKLIVQKHKKMEKLHQESQATVKALEERLSQEENTVNVLRKDVEDKDNTLIELRGSVKQFADKSQDLMRENMSLKDLLQEFEKLTSTEVQQAHHQVHKELASCVSEIQYLIDLCSQIAEGQDPNISALLGIKGQTQAPMEEDPGHPSNPFGIAVAKAKLKRIRSLRSEIDKLRTFVSDKYAEDVGNNCITQ